MFKFILLLPMMLILANCFDRPNTDEDKTFKNVTISTLTCQVNGIKIIYVTDKDGVTSVGLYEYGAKILYGTDMIAHGNAIPCTYERKTIRVYQ